MSLSLGAPLTPLPLPKELFYFPAMEKETSLKQVVFDSASVFLLDTSVLVLVFCFLEKIVNQQPISFIYGSAILIGSAITFVVSCFCKVWKLK